MAHVPRLKLPVSCSDMDQLQIRVPEDWLDKTVHQARQVGFPRVFMRYVPIVLVTLEPRGDLHAKPRNRISSQVTFWVRLRQFWVRVAMGNGYGLTIPTTCDLQSCRWRLSRPILSNMRF